MFAGRAAPPANIRAGVIVVKSVQSTAPERAARLTAHAVGASESPERKRYKTSRPDDPTQQGIFARLAAAASKP
jgi:hypothetical protein